MKKNLTEFLIAGALLYFVVPFVQEEWDYNFRLKANPAYRQLKAAVSAGKAWQVIGNLLNDFSQSKGRKPARRISLSIPTAASSNVIIQVAQQYIGVPYRHGGASKSGMDCSGFTSQVFRKNNIRLPRTAAQQFQCGEFISSMQALKPGDLVFFTYSWLGKPTHVGIYAGDFKMLHASSMYGVILCAGIDTRHHRRRFVGGKRIVNH